MFTYQQLIRLGVMAIIICVVALQLSEITEALGLVWDAIFPLLLGAGFAFILHILMQWFEARYFPRATSGWQQATRSSVSLFLSIITIVFIIGFIGNMAIPQLVISIGMIVQALPSLYQHALTWIYEWGIAHPTVAGQIQTAISWDTMTANATSWSASIGQYALRSISQVVSILTDVILAFIFAMYILLNKGELQSQCSRLLQAVLPDSPRQKFYHMLSVANETFRNFIVGQVLDAIILGVMIGIGLGVTGVSYALTIACVVGLTALIPLIGGAIGALMGLIMLLAVSPIEAGIYLLVFVVMQQIEGNIIYPRIVGDSVGLPGIWVFASITVGGTLYGVTGILLSVPIMATIYKLGSESITKRLEQGQSSISSRNIDG